jgi:hypothetical protein
MLNELRRRDISLSPVHTGNVYTRFNEENWGNNSCLDYAN